MRRHRVRANRPSAPNGTTADSISPLFSDLIVGSVDQLVELESCIPFTYIRPLCSSGVRRLISSFLGSENTELAEDDTAYQSSGFALGSDIPMVVPLTGSLAIYVHEHFKKEGLTGDELRERIKSRPVWHGIVDGLHSHSALVFIKNNHRSWNQFRWYVKILNGGFSIDKYRQLARVQNGRHHPHFYIELTLFDVLYNLRLEHERLKCENKKSGGSETAQAYDGAQHAKNSTLQQKANVSIRLPMSVLEELGKIMNEDVPELILSANKNNRRRAQNADDLMKLEDCRLFKKFISVATLKGSTSFMNVKGTDAETLQILCLHRVKDLYVESSLRAIKSDDLTNQLKLSKLALNEQNKFLKFMERDSWPREMLDTKKNLLRTIMFDKEIEENSNNENFILPKLLQTYRRHFPETAALKEAKWNASIETRVDSSPSKNHDKIAESSRTDQAQESPSAQNDTQAIVPELEVDDIVVDENAVIRDNDIYYYNMDWKQYLTDERNAESSRFDFLITCPPSAPSRSFIKTLRQSHTTEEIEKEDIHELCKFMKRVLKSGAYVVLLIHFTMFQEWYEAMESSGILVMPEQYIITYDLESVKRRKLTHFTQSAHEVALVAKLPGAHPDSFLPPFESMNDDGNVSLSRRHSLITNIPVMKSPLTRNNSKVPFDTREFHPDLFQQLIDLLCPVGGSVIDPYSRTMTSAIACFRGKRSCHVIEKHKECF